MYLKRFIRRTLLSVVLPLLVMLAGYEWLYRAIPNAYKVKDAYLSHQAAAVETLILGSSHTFFGIDPSCFDCPAFNAANVSQDLEYDWFILNKYIRSLPALKQVILPISYFTLFGSLRTGEEDWRIRKYQIYMGAQDYPFYDVRHNYEFSRLGDRDCMFYYLKSTNIYSCTPLGMGDAYSKSKRLPDWEKNGRERALGHTIWDKSDSLLIKENLSYLDSIVRLCCSRDVHLLLVTMPTWHTYYENLDARQLNQMYDLIHQVVSDNLMVGYLDLLKDPRWTADDYFDADHLNEFGAQKTAKILDQYFIHNRPAYARSEID